ncbi:MAG: TusE/DsrC/DsvC family sulfur relay protein [Sulfurimicrobium sp.]|jgi:tRNA 2-thiouridine synthesizing protein E|nr:TusE/DsrC/DsvC family sulfur relay protein [Sulfurimicrobium sp.]MDP2961126.1 TusE/DsrC/DsvC family sulfur relay protein [Sulfurimicrobium sp.]MDZ7657338.1 TusE/DsrC/DsvC family sulfur relay protein [Sulfurimicrobium sp.]
MFDINQMTADAARSRGPQGMLAELDDWSVRKAEEMAREEGLTLTEAHWEVIHLLRENYRHHGLAPHARQLLGGLEERFGREGGRKYLYQLFPRGPISQGCKIAGLPLPPYSSDLSFGSVE